MEWNDLERLLASPGVTTPDNLVAELVRLDEKRRRRLSAPLTKHVQNWWREIAETHVHSLYASTSAEEHRREEAAAAGIESMRLAVVGATTGAAAVAKWLIREAELYYSAWPNFPDERRLLASRRQADRLSRVLASRDDAWVLDLFESLAPRLRNAGRSEWRDFVIGKMGELGIDPPATADFFRCWIGRYIDFSHHLTYEDRLRRLRADPLLRPMLDTLFAVDGLGEHFSTFLWTDFSKRALPTYLESLLEHGDIDRDLLIDGCLRRLVRGGRAGDLAPYRKLLEHLEPGPAELAARARDLAALLPDSAPVVAGFAQKALRTADEAGLLDGELVVEAGDRVLFRPEKKLARDQLTWIDKAIRRHPDSAADLAATLASAFTHASTDVQARAVELAMTHAAVLTPAARATMAERATALPVAERERLSATLGIETPDPPRAVAVIPAPPRRPRPEPVGSVAELAERLAGLRSMLNTDPHGENLEAVTLEPVLEALVAFADEDRQGLATALRPVLSELDFITPEWYSGVDVRLLDGVMYAAVRATGDAHPISIDADILYGREVPEERQTRERSARAVRWRRGLARMSGPERVLALRLMETALRIVERPLPKPLSTPTDAMGRVRPATVIERLRHNETHEREPWEFDFQQALLRMPEPTADEIAAAEELTGPAGRRLADWLTGRSRPEVSVTDRPMVMYDRHGSEAEIALPLAEVAVRQPDSNRGGVRLLDQLRLSFPRRVLEEDVTVQRPDWPRAWSAVFPVRRDVLAAHLSQLLGPEAYWDLVQPQEDRYYLSMLPELAEADGPAGVGLIACLAFGLNVSGTGDRAGVVDAFTVLAAREQLDTEAVAAVTADLVAARLGKCTRIASSLREIADSGAQRQVWDILAGMLPRLLSAEPVPNRVSDLVELAARTAEAVAVHGGIPAITEVAARRGSSKLVKEAKRLHEYLTR